MKITLTAEQTKKFLSYFVQEAIELAKQRKYEEMKNKEILNK